MSNGESEAADGQQRRSKQSFLDSMIEAILSMGLPASKALSEHAVHKHHEDVPDGAVKAPEECVSVLSSIIPVDSRCPARLLPLIPPPNFGAVVSRCVYRSSYPQVENFDFLKRLNLKSIITLVPGEISTEYSQFMKANGIQHFQVPLPANKGSIKIEACQMSKALSVVLDRSNHPILIHCNKGKHRTGCVVGCLRKIQGEDLDTIYNEYHTYAGQKARILDEGYMELFDANTVLWMARRYDWVLPGTEVPSLAQVPSLSTTSLSTTKSAA